MKPADWTAADDDAAWAEMRDCLCPECNGNGWDGGAEVAPQPWDCPPEWEGQECPACAGTGVLTAPGGEAA